MAVRKLIVQPPASYKAPLPLARSEMSYLDHMLLRSPARHAYEKELVKIMANIHVRVDFLLR